MTVQPMEKKSHTSFENFFVLTPLIYQSKPDSAEETVHEFLGRLGREAARAVASEGALAHLFTTSRENIGTQLKQIADAEFAKLDAVQSSRQASAEQASRASDVAMHLASCLEASVREVPGDRDGYTRCIQELREKLDVELRNNAEIPQIVTLLNRLKEKLAGGEPQEAFINEVHSFLYENILELIDAQLSPLYFQVKTTDRVKELNQIEAHGRGYSEAESALAEDPAWREKFRKLLPLSFAEIKRLAEAGEI